MEILTNKIRLSWYGGKKSLNPVPLMKGVNFDGLDCFVRLGQDIRGAVFEDCSFRKASFGEMYLSRVVFVRCDFRRADLAGGDFNLTRLDGCDLRGADLRTADFRGASLRGADLRGARLDHSQFGHFGDVTTDIRQLVALPEDLAAIEHALSVAKPTKLTRAQTAALAGYREAEGV